MNVYSVLLVDDEEEVIQIIMKKVDWESMGFRVAGYAHNGVEALEMAEELQPDIVLTDIKMPYMDGLTLSKRLKELYKTIKIIIFSGFDEFEYAKEAIKLEVEEYLLKPINAAELKEVFTRIWTNLDQERDEKRNIHKLQEYYLESLPLIQENFFTSLIEGRISKEQIESALTNYQIQLDGPYYIVTILHVSKQKLPEDMNPFLLTVSVKKLAEEQLVERYKCRTLMYLGDVVLISQLETPEETVAYTDAMDEFCRMAKTVCAVCVTAGIGQICETLEELRMSYQGAENAISYRAIYGNTRAINIAEIEPSENSNEPWEDQLVHEIIKEIKLGDKEGLEESFKSCKKHFSASNISLQKYRIFIISLIAEITRFGNNNQLNMEQIYGKYNDIYSMAFQSESPEDLWGWLLEISCTIQEMIAAERQNTTKTFVTKAMEYVQECYTEQDISIETVCKKLGVSSAYFSTVFKKETGKTFISYLTDYRMEQAVELLMTTGDKTYIIAEKVGYADPNYFSYAFKKKYGMSPSKYRVGK